MEPVQSSTKQRSTCIDRFIFSKFLDITFFRNLATNAESTLENNTLKVSSTLRSKRVSARLSSSAKIESDMSSVELPEDSWLANPRPLSSSVSDMIFQQK